MTKNIENEIALKGLKLEMTDNEIDHIKIKNIGTKSHIELENKNASQDLAISGEITRATDAEQAIVDANNANSTFMQNLLQRQLLVQYDFEPVHLSRNPQFADNELAKTMYFKVGAGRIFMDWDNPNGRIWTLPVGTVLYSDGTTPVLTSTDQSVDVIIPHNGGVVTLHSDSWEGNYYLNSSGVPTPQVKLRDLPKLEYWLQISGITDSLANLKGIPLTGYCTISYSLGTLSGALPVPVADGWRADKINLSSSASDEIEVANSIVNMASYWNGKTALTGAFLNFGTMQAEYDVTTEVAQLVTAGFTVTYTSF